MTTKQELYKKLNTATSKLLNAEEDIERIQKELDEYQEPTMPVDTLCEVWTSKMNRRVRYFSHMADGKYCFFQLGATSKTNDEIQIEAWPNHKIIEEPVLPWRDIDNNVPEAKVYLIDPRDGKGFMLKYSKDAIEGIFEEGQYIILKE